MRLRVARVGNVAKLPWCCYPMPHYDDGGNSCCDSMSTPLPLSAPPASASTTDPLSDRGLASVPSTAGLPPGHMYFSSRERVASPTATTF